MTDDYTKGWLAGRDAAVAVAREWANNATVDEDGRGLLLHVRRDIATLVPTPGVSKVESTARPEMTDAETAAHLLGWADAQQVGGPFGWPTDPCGYHQHIRFVKHRNDNWNASGPDDFRAFVRAYAHSLTKPGTPEKPCETCRGEGYGIRKKCVDCNGTGRTGTEGT